MSVFDPLLEQMKVFKRLSPNELRRLADVQLDSLLEKEATRARGRVEELGKRYPSAQPREHAQRLIDGKKQLASMVGGVTGVFGVVTVPLDLVGMVYLQLSLLAEIASVFKVNLRSAHARRELLELFGYTNGIGPLQRSTPRVVGSLAAALLARGGLGSLSRAMPLVAAPVSAYLNNQHVQRVGDAAVRHYEGWVHAHEKTKKASGH
jgi:hypothetical protein